MSASASRLSDAGLALRSLRAFRGGLLLLAVVALVASTALSAWPRIASALLTAELRHELTQSGPGGRDIGTALRSSAQAFSPQLAVDPVAAWDALPAITASARDRMTPPLRRVTGSGDFSAALSAPVEPPAGAPANSRYLATVEAYRDLRSAARLVSGAWPSAIGSPLGPDAVVPIVLTGEAAKLVGWSVGQDRRAGIGETSVRLRLTGLVEPRTATAEFWALDPVRRAGHFVDEGDKGKDYGAVAWVDPGSWKSLAPKADGTEATIWFPVLPERFQVEDLAAVRGALGGFLASPPAARVGGSSVPLTFATSMQRPLDDFQARAQPANTLFAILASGPLVVALTVLALGARLVVSRRRDALRLMAARGAAPARLRASLALDAAVASVPAAAIGLLLALVLTPAATPLALPVALAALCAVVPPIALVVAAGSLAPGPVLAGRPRWAWVAEVTAVALAGLSVVLLGSRGLASPGTGMEVDPLAALTPVLVALAACVLVLRVTVFPLGWLAGVFRRGRGAVGLLGASGARGAGTQGARAGVAWPVFALIAGVSIALFSVSMLATARTGLEDGARARVGSDLSLTAATSLSADQVAAVKRLPGVAHTATVEFTGGVSVSVSGSSQIVSGYLVDPAELAAVQQDVPAPARLAPALRGVLPGRTGAILGGWDSRIPVTSALILDRSTLPASSGVTASPQTVLVALAPGADAQRVHGELARIGGAGAVVGDAAAERARLTGSPLVGGTETIALLSIGLTVLLCVVALLLTLVMNTAARIRLVATLRTIGFTARQTAGVLAWELGPVLVVGLVAGAVVGLLLPGLVLGPLDLRGFTGSPVRPDVVGDPLLTAAALAGFAVVAALATVVALAGARRASPAAVLRMGDPG